MVCRAQKAKTPFALACQGGSAEAARILACTGCHIPIGTTMMDEYRKQAKFMDRKASWIKTKQVLALLDNLEKVKPPDWGDWFRNEWPAVLSDIDADHKTEVEEVKAIEMQVQHTMVAREQAMKMKAASQAQKRNRLKAEVAEAAAKAEAEASAARAQLRKETEEQEAAERASQEAHQARDDAERQQRVKKARDAELARAQQYRSQAEAIARGEGIELPPSPEPEPEPEPDDHDRVTFTRAALHGGSPMDSHSRIPAAPTGRTRGFSDTDGSSLPTHQPPPPSEPYFEPGSPGSMGEESSYQRTRYEDTMDRQWASPSAPPSVTSPRWALTGGASGEGQRVSATPPRSVSRTDSGALYGSMRGLRVQEVELSSGAEPSIGLSARRAAEDVIGVDGHIREGLALSPGAYRSGSLSAGDAPVRRTLSPARTSAASVLSVSSPPPGPLGYGRTLSNRSVVENRNGLGSWRQVVHSPARRPAASPSRT